MANEGMVRKDTKSAAVILAAGMGVRMKSDLPKVLHPLLGEPMIRFVIRALEQAGASNILAVLGHGAAQVEEALKGRIKPVYQEKQLGTGHALRMALPELMAYRENGIEECLVVYGDTPLLTGETLTCLRNTRRETGAAAAVLTALFDKPEGYGRIIKEGDRVVAIVEEKDADAAQQKVNEINVGAYAFDIDWLAKALEEIRPVNAQGEYYLTDVIAWLSGQGQAVVSWQTHDAEEALGINDRLQLAKAQDLLRHRILEGHMREGVTVEEPAATIIGPFVEIGRDSFIETGCQIFGQTVIGKSCVIGPRSRITDCRIGDESTINQTTAMECEIGNRCDVGPYTYLRPGCVLGDGAKAGTFVEMKKAIIAPGAKVPHLSYMGDCFVGERVNVGAGTITCNYDGKDKHQTIIGADAFIGSNSNLVAPVTVGEGAYTAAGSTITEDVPAEALGIARGRQKNIIGWKRAKHSANA